jgi:CheY-like chemotaxis protein
MGKPTILIVDDEANIRGALFRWFEIRGFDVAAAADGLEAVSLCAENCYDVITMDLEMPRMGGIEALTAIRKTHPNVPILVVTGYARDAQRALNAGAVKVLTKPLRLSDLEDEVRGVLPLPTER